MTSNTSRSMADLAGDAVSQLAKLIGNEFDLARAELSAKIGQAGRGAAMIGAGAIILVPALVILLIAIAQALLLLGLAPPVAYAATGGGALFIALVLILIGVSRLSPSQLKPNVTLEQIERDKMAAREMTR